MKKLGSIWRKHSLWIMFLFVISVGGIGTLPGLYVAAKAQYASRTLDTSVAEAEYEDNFWHHSEWIDIRGGMAKLLGEKLINGVLKGTDGKLYLMDDVEYVFDKTLERKSCDDTVKILDAAKESGAAVLYAQRTYKTGELPYGYDFKAKEEQYRFWGQEIENQGFPVLDTKEELADHLRFYTTDHHWTVETAFYAAGKIVNKLNQEYGFKLEEELLDRDKYDELRWEDSFLGSLGIRTGKYFAGKDDFVMLEPMFQTDFAYEHLVEGKLNKAREGSFMEAFVDISILNDPGYSNKFNACLNGGYVENIILNRQNKNGLKMLVIADSFARPMVQYLSLCFQETLYLDPQEGRYNDSFIEYIEENRPDIVVIMYSGEYVTP